MDPVVFRKPLGVLAVMAVVLVAVGLSSPWPVSWAYVGVFLFVFGLLSWRQRLVLTSEGVEVTNLGTRRIPWSQVVEFRAGTWWRGGILVMTRTGPVWSPAPASWWGGPAKAADVATLEQRARDRR